jgi:hypothetical protein
LRVPPEGARALNGARPRIGSANDVGLDGLAERPPVLRYEGRSWPFVASKRFPSALPLYGISDALTLQRDL